MAKPGDRVDWQDGKSLSECMIYMLEKEIMCDVTFRVGTDQSIIKAHKYMLASRSPVFYTMFEGSCPEKGEIIVPDINSEIFKALLKWVSHQCEVQGKTASGENMRKISGSLLYLVRFPFVNKEYFAKMIAHSALLTFEEVVSVFSSHDGRKNEFFTGSVRHSRLFNKKYTVLRHGRIGNKWTPYKDIINYDALSIKVNKNIELESVILYGPDGYVSSSAENLTVKILNDSGNEICSQKCESYMQSRELQTVNLSEPIELDSNKYFTVIIVGLKFEAHCGRDCKPDYKIDDIIVTFKNSPNCNTTTNVEQGQIAGIEFNV
ncbi:unnamed protein product [Mytilus coruscus]|uniref:BTB domain-containing protein n=1 Tax=Mytilus coruscus TaxID=42192 RepID=A0A6J8D6U0_MYTCO|nr:unnamed protein product [Mytilus coruscus]